MNAKKNFFVAKKKFGVILTKLMNKKSPENNCTNICKLKELLPSRLILTRVLQRTG